MELTQEQQDEIKKRKEDFLKRYEALVEEFQVDFAGAIVKLPIGNGLWADSIRMDLMDKKYLITPSTTSDQIINK